MLYRNNCFFCCTAHATLPAWAANCVKNAWQFLLTRGAACTASAVHTSPLGSSYLTPSSVRYISDVKDRAKPRRTNRAWNVCSPFSAVRRHGKTRLRVRQMTTLADGRCNPNGEEFADGCYSCLQGEIAHITRPLAVATALDDRRMQQ